MALVFTDAVKFLALCIVSIQYALPHLLSTHLATARSSNHAVFHPEPIPTMPALHLVSCTAGSALPPMEGVMLLPENVSERSSLRVYH